MDYFLTIATLILIFIILNQSYNLIIGYTGMVHLGHVAFMAIGAYTSAILTTAYGTPFWFGLLSGIILAALAGLLLGIQTVRFRDSRHGRNNKNNTYKRTAIYGRFNRNSGYCASRFFRLGFKK